MCVQSDIFKEWSLSILSDELEDQFVLLKMYLCPGWCGSVDCQPTKGRVPGLIPRQPGLQARSPAGGVQEATSRCFSPSLSLPPHSLKINF